KVRELDGRKPTAESLTTIWDDLLSNNLHAEGGVRFPDGKKPEALLKRVLEMSTEPGDLVLDAFAGSGTTAAVAHKMGRPWVAIEMGDQCSTMIPQRLRGVIDGVDPHGVTRALGWKGGGGFCFYEVKARSRRA